MWALPKPDFPANAFVKLQLFINNRNAFLQFHPSLSQHLANQPLQITLVITQRLSKFFLMHSWRLVGITYRVTRCKEWRIPFRVHFPVA